MFYSFKELYFNNQLFLIIKFKNKPIEDYSFKLFLSLWNFYCFQEKPIQFIFDIRKFQQIPSLSYCFSMAHFLYTIKNKQHNLIQSIIIYQKDILKYLLDFIFYIQKPIAPVYLYKTDQQLKDIFKILPFTKANLLKNMNYISP